MAKYKSKEERRRESFEAAIASVKKSQSEPPKPNSFAPAPKQ